MKKTIRHTSKVIPIALSLALGSSLVLAQKSSQTSAQSSIQLDPARTTIRFSAGTVRHVHGTFQLKKGLFAIDPKTGVAQGEILVDASSEKSDDAKLDKTIQGKVLEVGKYPEIFFHAEKVSGSLPAKDGESYIKLGGSINIHGADHPLIVDLDTSQVGNDVTFRTTFVVPYVDWGMKDASTLFMRGRKVRITIESHGTAASASSGL